jgi:uncharacterized membrane protein YebE (DUF533 family)
MNTRGLLDQLLKSGQDCCRTRQAARRTRLPVAWAGCFRALAAVRWPQAPWGCCWVAKARKVGGKVAVYGGLAALGVLAYKAYGNWQAGQGTAPKREPQTLDRLPTAQVEQHSQAILKALVAAAKADGHIDERERELIEGDSPSWTTIRNCNTGCTPNSTNPSTRPTWPAPQYAGNGRRDVHRQRDAGG